MNSFNLMNIFNGFIKNYENLNLNVNDSNEEFIKKENKFFIMIGQFLGYQVLLKKGPKFFNKEIVWISSDIENKKVLSILREDDLTKDLENIQNLVNYLKDEEETIVINIVETSSQKRVDYLNNIILTSKLCIKKEVLVIYIIRDILNSTNYLTANIFFENKLVSSKKALISSKSGEFIGEFIVH